MLLYFNGGVIILNVFLIPENGDENMVLGLCADESAVYENVKVKIGLEEETELPSCCLLLCLTLEGKLVMFYVARYDGPHPISNVEFVQFTFLL